MTKLRRSICFAPRNAAACELSFPEAPQWYRAPDRRAIAPLPEALRSNVTCSRRTGPAWHDLVALSNNIASEPICAGASHAGLLGRPVEDQRSGPVQEIHRSVAADLRQIRRQGAGARRAFSDHGRTGEIPPLRGDRISHLRAGGRLLQLARISGRRRTPPWWCRRGRERHRRRRRRDAALSLAITSGAASDRKKPRPG